LWLPVVLLSTGLVSVCMLIKWRKVSSQRTPIFLLISTDDTPDFGKKPILSSGLSQIPVRPSFVDRLVVPGVKSLRIQKKELVLATVFGLGLGLTFLVSPWLGLVVVGGGLFVVLALNKPVILPYVVVLAIIFFSGMSRGKIIPFFIPNEPILVITAALAIPIVLSRHRGFPSKVSIFTVGWVSLAFGTSIFPFLIYLIREIDLSVTEIFSLIAPLQYLLIYWVFRFLPSNEKEVRDILRLMLVCAAVIGIVGLLQTLHVGFVLNILDNWYRSPHEEEALAIGRISSLLGAWNSLGTFLMFNLIILRACIGIKPELISRKTFLFIVLFCAASLIASGSYAALGGLILGLFMFELFNRKGGWVTVAIFLGMAILAIPLRENILQRVTFQYGGGGSLVPQTLAFRFKVWKDVFWPVVEKTWLWGFRPVIPSTLSWAYAESEYFLLLIRSGIFSLLAHLLWVGLTLVWLVCIMRTSNGLLRALSTSAFILIIVLSIMGLTNEVFTFSGVVEYLWILLALIGVLGNNTLEIEHDSSIG
jgi:hypothetical protein